MNVLYPIYLLQNLADAQFGISWANIEVCSIPQYQVVALESKWLRLLYLVNRTVTAQIN